ncbi:hypothetical protein DFH06DRAFT_1170235 [Mycena polygramma]|nr:hypothetical protein DFH06DRAFT_1170235 [Mycena polygramma]
MVMTYFAELTSNARKKLIESSDELKGYTRTIKPAKLTWFAMGNYGEHAVSIEAAEKAERAKEDHIQDPTLPVPGALEPFVFSIIVDITADNFFASSCGRWSGPTLGARTFAEQKLNFTGAAPTNEVLARDFDRACQKILKLFASAKSSEMHQRKGVFVNDDDPTKMKLRFHHPLFEKIADGDEEDDDDNIPEAFKIDQWPVRHEAARKARDKMTSTHRVNYLPAYDASREGKLILPGDYETQLPGALAQIKFTLSHWDFKKDRRDVFNANIVHIRVLKPPPTTSSPNSPGKPKRPFAATDEMSGDISPKKARPSSAASTSG